MNYRLNRAAEMEFANAAVYYDVRQPGLGLDFTKEVNDGIRQILEAPDRWPEQAAGLRRFRIERFPYGLFYRILSGGDVEIVAVADLRRRPGYWLDRLR